MKTLDEIKKIDKDFERTLNYEIVIEAVRELIYS